MAPIVSALTASTTRLQLETFKSVHANNVTNTHISQLPQGNLLTAPNALSTWSLMQLILAVYVLLDSFLIQVVDASARLDNFILLMLKVSLEHAQTATTLATFLPPTLNRSATDVLTI